MSVLAAHALTTAARVKVRLEIASGTTTWDALLESLINAATDKIEDACGGRRFLRGTITSEILSPQSGDKFVYLKRWPIVSITSVEYRPGTVSTPSWTTLLADFWETVEDGSSGCLAIYSSLPWGTNNLRVTYVAGYLIDFANQIDPTKHTLPFTLSDLCERMVVAAFKKRPSEGLSSEQVQEYSRAYRENSMSEEDNKMLADFRRTIFS